MVSANKEMAVYCFDTLVAHYNGDEAPPAAFDEGQQASSSWMYWNSRSSWLDQWFQGLCINQGTRGKDLIFSFPRGPVYDALRDRRFPPIQAKELPYLECTVSVLTDYEAANNYLDWEIGKHGIIIEFTDPDYNTRRSATYLPDVAAHEGWTKIEAIDSLIRKAGYNGLITESVRRQIQLTRYQSTLFTLHYSEYVSYVKEIRGDAPSIVGAKLLG